VILIIFSLVFGNLFPHLQNIFYIKIANMLINFKESSVINRANLELKFHFDQLIAACMLKFRKMSHE